MLQARCSRKHAPALLHALGQRCVGQLRVVVNREWLRSGRWSFSSAARDGGVAIQVPRRGQWHAGLVSDIELVKASSIAQVVKLRMVSEVAILTTSRTTHSTTLEQGAHCVCRRGTGPDPGARPSRLG